MTDQAQKDRFVAALTALGGSAGNGKLRDALGWNEATYNAVKQALIDEGAIVPGRGRGGSISIADADAVAPAAAQAAKVDRQVRAARPNTTAANVGYLAIRGIDGQIAHGLMQAIARVNEMDDGYAAGAVGPAAPGAGTCARSREWKRPLPAHRARAFAGLRLGGAA